MSASHPPPTGSRACEPTLRGEIKKARAGNYDLCACLLEYMDNALDAGADRIRVDIRERTSHQGFPHKILISDNVVRGIDPDALRAIFSWTYERPRRDGDIGEYGVGFKAASVNLADKLTVFTQHAESCMQAIADWQDMADENRWVPKILTIPEEYYGDIHPFHKGSTFLLESLRHEMVTVSDADKKWTIRRLFDDLAYHYRYLMQENPALTLTIKGIWTVGGEIEERDVRSHELFRTAIEPTGASGQPPSRETLIRVYQDSLQFYRVYFQTAPPRWETVEFLERRKNGNSVLRCHEVSPSLFDGMRLIDTVRFRSFHHTDMARSALCMGLYTPCALDIVRRGRVVGRDLTLRAPRADPLTFFVRHEAWYGAHALNALLGVQYNKQNHGAMRENDLRYTLEHLQQLHEREFLRAEKLRPSPSPSPVTAISPPRSASEISLGDRHPDADAHPDLVPATGDDALGRLSASSEIRRRHFSPQTKIGTLHRQECRDSILDFVLKDEILLMEYDHKNGVPTVNTPENCQALSVITHAIKTRCPAVFDEIEHDPSRRLRFITDLLNCLTRSRFFLEAWTAGQVVIRQPHQLSAVQNGIFDLLP